MGTCIAFFVVMGDLAPPIASEMLDVTPNATGKMFPFDIKNRKKKAGENDIFGTKGKVLLRFRWPSNGDLGPPRPFGRASALAHEEHFESSRTQHNLVELLFFRPHIHRKKS